MNYQPISIGDGKKFMPMMGTLAATWLIGAILIASPPTKAQVAGSVEAGLAELAKQYTDDALETLRSIAAEGESESARVSAANALLDRGYGRPSQAIQHSGADDGPIIFNTIYESPPGE